VSNITFSKGLVVTRDTVMKPIDNSNKVCFTKSATDMKKVYLHIQTLSNPSSDSMNFSGVDNISNSECVVETDELSNGDLVNKVKDFSKYFKSYTRYIVDFSHVAKSNIT
jgi:hypothetical protein